jgi:hypothetical protein
MTARWVLTCQACYWQGGPTDLVENPARFSVPGWLCPRCGAGCDGVHWEIEKDGRILHG